MTRVVIKFKDGSHLNLPGDCIEILDDTWISAWNGDARMLLVRFDEVVCAYVSKKNDVVGGDPDGKS